ncbi:MAG: DUF3341 domain-containing protein [Lentisphaeria bacterium]|nr:DUF3341 domain-containing protein [Lentisphaeria bacterium]
MQEDIQNEINKHIDNFKHELEVSGLGIADEPGKIVGIIGEFENPGALMAAATKVRDAGYANWDCHSPFPIHGMDDAMGLKHSILGVVVFCAGTVGCMTGLLMQWWMNAVDYPMNISGKPFFPLPALIPITFELTILFSAFAAVFGMFIINKLPRLHHPLFYSENFGKVSDDAFFVSIEAVDNVFDPNRSWAFLESIGATNVEFLQVDE